ncbi:DUF1648 domain-containing protein [Larkinella sp. VNQ87]|uniref:DUF1648 domain-containing protein n=1 Tax=Larkinella sp. VNQ87 TaxID=3400921 RepID=UPI003C0F1D7E
MKAIFFTSASVTERWLTGLAMLLVISQFVLVLSYYTELPETIPVHFGSGGKPDRWGSRGNLFVVPGLSVFFFLLFRGLRQIPAEYYNQPTPPTPENRERLLRNTHQMLILLLFVIQVFMTWTFWNWLEAASSPAPVVNKTLVTALLLPTIASVILFYLVRAYRRA